ncbi:hypothetical protein BLNAU_7289 [Blattamonas nauphoetae]|uniref:Uncharacterized protein n=1 Tax=Blattamonas nauphoetae TaxID=2049346 RepID=A0ABQ9Y280_9EUKA|nr:hypothetical protein BLNAU_7289 [Blattamonas nauphoetae]
MFLKCVLMFYPFSVDALGWFITLCSFFVIALVRDKYPFHNALQDKAALFLKSLEPKDFDRTLTNKLVTHLVPSSVRSPSGFVESIVTLLSSPHSTVVEAALSFLNETMKTSSPAIRYPLVELDLITNLFATVHPHTLPISGNEPIFDNLIEIIRNCVDLAHPSRLSNLGITTTVGQYTHREMILQKVVIHVFLLNTTLINILSFLSEWKNEGPEVAQSGKRMMQALISEGFEDMLEQMLKRDEGSLHLEAVGIECEKAVMVASRMLIRNRLSRMTPPRFCGLASEIGNALIAGADEQIQVSPPIVQKCHIVNRPLSKQFLVSQNDAL